MVSNGEAADPAAGQSVSAADEARSAVFEAFRGEVMEHYSEGTGPLERSIRYFTEDLAAFEAAIKAEAQRELAARVLPVLERVEWVAFADIVSMCGGCYPVSGAYGHKDGCPVAALIAELRALSEETGDGTDE